MFMLPKTSGTIVSTIWLFVTNKDLNLSKKFFAFFPKSNRNKMYDAGSSVILIGLKRRKAIKSWRAPWWRGKFSCADPKSLNKFFAEIQIDKNILQINDFKHSRKEFKNSRNHNLTKNRTNNRNKLFYFLLKIIKLF